MTKPVKTKATKTPTNSEVQQPAMPSITEKPPTKNAIIISLISRETGATLAELTTATDWKPHSIRGHLSNLRKKKGLEITSNHNSEGVKIYTIKSSQEGG